MLLKGSLILEKWSGCCKAYRYGASIINMKRIISVLLPLVFCFAGLKAQKTLTILECTYKQNNSDDNNNVNPKEFIIRITDNIIGYWGERDGELVLLSVFNFEENQHKMIGISGHVNLFSLDNNRKKAEFVNCNEPVNSFNANAKIFMFDESKPSQYMNEISKTYDTVYFDTTLKIAHYPKGGYVNFIDNGFGFLPVKTIRKVTKETDPVGYTITTELVSKKEVLISKEEWEKMLNTY